MRIIAHLDLDAFFAAVEERDNSRLKGKPIVVGHDPEDGRGRGIVSTANYAARKYGIHSAQPISTAWRLAEKARQKGEPETIFVHPDFERYRHVSERVFNIVRARVPVVEQASIDEAYLDLTFTGSYEVAVRLMQDIKAEIKERERLTASVGIGPNKLIAKIASDRQKPDGLTVVHSVAANAFLEPLPIRTLPGVGPKTEQFFRAKGVQTVKDLKKFSKETLIGFFGKWGESLYEKARGRDDSSVGEGREAKSIGEQETFHTDTLDLGFVAERLHELSRNVARRLEEEGFASFRRIVLTVRFADFTTVTRSKIISSPVSSAEALEFEAMKLLLPFFDSRENKRRKKIRLIGVRVERLG